jgi:hypothetical protein
MTNHPPMFAREAEEQGKWNEGFKAGIAEVLAELEASIDKGQDLEAPTKEWTSDFVAKINQKYL